MEELKELPFQCDRAWKTHEGKIYIARAYHFWNNQERKVIAFYVRPSGDRILVVETSSWNKAIKEFKKVVKQ